MVKLQQINSTSSLFFFSFRLIYGNMENVALLALLSKNSSQKQALSTQITVMEMAQLFCLK